MKKVLLCLLMFVTVSGCAWFSPLVEPEVEVTSIHLAPGSGFTQMLSIGVRVSNPNAFALKLSALDYRVSLEDQQVARGSIKERMEIPASGSNEFTVPVELNLFSGLSLIELLLKNPKDELDYRLDVDAHVATLGIGQVSIVKREKIRLTPQ